MTRRPRNSVKDRPARATLMLRRARKLLRPFAWLSGVAVVALGIAIAIHAASPDGTLASFRERLGDATAFAGLRVSKVVVKGRANTPEPLLRAAIGVHRGDPILGFSVEQARKRIETLSWVEHATVERRLPGTVVVHLQERRPFAIWQHDGKFVLIDRAGQIVAHRDVAQFRQLPLVVGAGAPEHAAALLDALTNLPTVQSHVTAAVRVGKRRWNLLMKNGTSVMLPEGHASVALDRLQQLQRDHEVLDRPLAVIDMRLPDRLVLRPRPDAHSDTAANPAAPRKPA